MLILTFDVHRTRAMAVTSLWAVVTVTWPSALARCAAAALAPFVPPARMLAPRRQATPSDSAGPLLMEGGG